MRHTAALNALLALAVLRLITLTLTAAGSEEISFDGTVSASGSYAVVVSEYAWSLPEWRQVAETLRDRHGGAVIIYAGSVRDVQSDLARLRPAYVCFVVQPNMAGRWFVVQVNRMMRALDDDPYEDAVWGVVTGRDAEAALACVSDGAPLEVRRGLASIPTVGAGALDELVAWGEGIRGSKMVRGAGGAPRLEAADQSPAEGIAAALNAGEVDAVLLAGHADAGGWRFEYAEPSGALVMTDEGLATRDFRGRPGPVSSSNPKILTPIRSVLMDAHGATVRVPAGNAMAGAVPFADAMPLALMAEAGVRQIVGYSAPPLAVTSDWPVERLYAPVDHCRTLSMASHARRQALIARLARSHPETLAIDPMTYALEGADWVVQEEGYGGGAIGWMARKYELDSEEAIGLLWDRDIAVLLGDPGWEARLPRHPDAPSARFAWRDGAWDLTVEAPRDVEFVGGPLFYRLPEVLRGAELLQAEGVEAPGVSIADDCVLLDLSAMKSGQSVRLTFRGEPLSRAATDEVAGVIHTGRWTEAIPAPGELPACARRAPAEWQRAVWRALDRAGDNRAEIEKFLTEAEDEYVRGAGFLVANMPDRDLTSLTADFLLTHLRWAYKARAETPWGMDIPEPIFFNDVLAYAALNERRDNYREFLFEKFMPVVADCRTPAEASIKLRGVLYKTLGVEFHGTKRPKADQSAMESIEAGYASCTGFTLLQVAANRSLCLPARAAGVPSWTNSSGNHTWVEVWDGQWYFLEGGELNQGWIAPRTAEADLTEPLHHIYASSFAKTSVRFPCVWDLEIDYVSAQDVSTYYKARQKVALHVTDGPDGPPAPATVEVWLDGALYGRRATGLAAGVSTPAEFELAAGERFEVVAREATSGREVRDSFTTARGGQLEKTLALPKE